MVPNFHRQRSKIYRFKGVDVMLNEGDEQFVTDGIREYAADIIAEIKNRFPNGSGSVLNCFDIFHLESLPDTAKLWSEYKDNYGMDELKTLVDHNSANVFFLDSVTVNTVVHTESEFCQKQCIGGLLYVDDLALISICPCELQSMLHACQHWSI